MGELRRLLVGTTAALTLFAGFTAGPASAEALHVTGSYTGTGTAFTPCSTAFGIDAQASGDWTALGPTSFTLHFCLGLFEETIQDGRFTITTADGTMAGDLTGDVLPGPGPEFPFRFVMAIGSAPGTGRFVGATGELVLDAAFGTGASTLHGSVDGTIDVQPPLPRTKDDCKKGGWRDVTDDQGRPFRNEGQCVAFVQHERAT